MWVEGVEEGGASVRTTQMTRQGRVFFIFGVSLCSTLLCWALVNFCQRTLELPFCTNIFWLSFFFFAFVDLIFMLISNAKVGSICECLPPLCSCSGYNNKKLSKTKPITRHAHTHAWGQVPRVFMTFMLIMLTPKCLSLCESIVLTAQCGLECRRSLATGLRRVCVIFGIPLYF